MALVTSITGSELVRLLRCHRQRTAVIDVRDDDFVGGHIAGAENIPRDTFKYTVEEQVQRLRSKDTVVFHCMMSQIRGPYCAQLFAKKLKEAGVEPSPKVSVLEGGFGTFAREFFKEKDLFEGIDERYWGPNAVF